MFWNVTDDDLDLAKAGDAAATERLYAAALPPCGRLAATLVGDQNSADRVLQKLADRSTEQLAHSLDADVAGRWFVHQTVFLSRNEPQPTDPTADTLMDGVGGPDAMAYQAMVAGLRKLPRQQQEAFLLHHVHGWNPRLCAVAMDCSTQAVHTHLNEAARTLTPLGAGHFAALLGAMRQVHQTRAVRLPQSPGRLATRAKLRQLGKKLRIVAEWMIALAVLVAIAAAVWLLRGRVKI